MWGGWLGVDMFFVLSGFLITTLLIREHRGMGSVSLRNFYARRILRLYPLILLALLVASLTTVFASPTSAHRTTPWGLVAMAFYFVNWVDISHRTAPIMGLFGHFWSLSIEEQFYLVWPLVVVVVLRARRTGLILLAIISAGVAITTGVLRSRMVWNAHRWQRGNPYAFGLLGTHRLNAWNDWYLGSFYHGDGLLIGCFLAVALSAVHRRPGRVVRALLGVAAVGAVVTMVVIGRLGNHHVEWPPMASRFLPMFTVSTSIVVAHLVMSPASPLARVLSVRPLVWTGRRAYGLYVFHPVFLVLVQSAAGHRGGWPLVLALVLSFVAAALSYRYLEGPILRQKHRFTRSRPAPTPSPVERPEPAVNPAQ
jgi:peptidoglycan/LPS O-acetylase OafA/YrhL